MFLPTCSSLSNISGLKTKLCLFFTLQTHQILFHVAFFFFFTLADEENYEREVIRQCWWSERQKLLESITLYPLMSSRNVSSTGKIVLTGVQNQVEYTLKVNLLLLYKKFFNSGHFWPPLYMLLKNILLLSSSAWGSPMLMGIRNCVGSSDSRTCSKSSSVMSFGSGTC